MKKLILFLCLIVSCTEKVPEPQPTKTVALAMPRNLGVDFAKLLQKYGAIPKDATCTPWEDTPQAQSAICEVNPQVAVYCVAPTGTMPSCKITIDTRQPAPETPATTPPKAPSPKH